MSADGAAAPLWGANLRRLVDAGMLDGRATVEGRVSIERRSRSNDVAVVSVGPDPQLVLKRNQLAVDGVDPYTAEAGAYRFLAADPSTVPIAPALRAAEHGVLVIDAVADARPLHEALHEDVDADAALAALGGLLGRLHRRRGGSPLLPRRPWVLGVVTGLVPEYLVPDDEVAACAVTMSRDEALRSALGELAGQWRPLAPMHGDVKFDNVLVGSRQGTPRLTLIDWELAGLGLPAWDVAGIVDGLLVPALQQTTIDAAIDARAAAAPAIDAHRLAVGPALAPTARQLDLATVARLVQSGLQLLAMRRQQQDCEKASATVIAGARRLAQRLQVQPRDLPGRRRWTT